METESEGLRCAGCGQPLPNERTVCEVCSPSLDPSMTSAFQEPGSMRISEELIAKFPDIRPLDQPPSLFVWNGFGVLALGHRDEDQETGTFIKTVCISFLWLPIFALAAYRVAKAGRGWYFLGGVPLSWQAVLFNIVVLGFVVVMLVRHFLL